MAVAVFEERRVGLNAPRQQMKSALVRFFRIRAVDVSLLQWLPRYTLRSLGADAAAAAVVASMLIPQAMAYAVLAGLDPVYGLYSSIFPLLIFSMITTSSQVAPGPNA
jgi:fatty acid desaturase